jgi:hypothetical protein
MKNGMVVNVEKRFVESTVGTMFCSLCNKKLSKKQETMSEPFTQISISAFS